MERTLVDLFAEESEQPVPDESLTIAYRDVLELPKEFSGIPTKADNPSHQEDFNSLLDAATKAPQSDGET